MIVDAKRRLAIHHLRWGIVLRAGMAGVYVMSGTRLSHSLAPGRIVYIFYLDSDRSVRIERLFTSPFNRLEYSRTKFDFRRKLNLPDEAVVQQERAFAVADAGGLSRIE